MKTHRQELRKTIQAFELLCINCAAEKKQKLMKERIQYKDVKYIEMKLERLALSVNGSRYKDLKSELLSLISVVDYLSKEA
jgi:hypothetical protein